MKDEKKKIKKIAQRIAELEKKCMNDIKNKDIYMAEMMQLTGNLSLEELLQIDEYIVGSNILKK